MCSLSVLKSSGTSYISAMEMSWASLATMKTMCRLMMISTPWGELNVHALITTVQKPNILRSGV